MSKFKVGDKVKLLNGESWYMYDMRHCVGQVAVVAQVMQHDTYLVTGNRYHWHETWLEAVPDKPKKMFQQGDHIVVLTSSTGNAYIKGHCYKQKMSNYYLKSIIDSNGDCINSWNYIQFNNQSLWRYATVREVMEYERLGKPFDTTIFDGPQGANQVDLLNTSSNGTTISKTWLDQQHDCWLLKLHDQNNIEEFLPIYPLTPKQCFKILQSPIIIPSKNKPKKFKLI